MKINKYSKDYLKSTNVRESYRTEDGVKLTRKLYVTGSKERVEREAEYLRRRLIP